MKTYEKIIIIYYFLIILYKTFIIFSSVLRDTQGSSLFKFCSKLNEKLDGMVIFKNDQIFSLLWGIWIFITVIDIIDLIANKI